MQELVRDIRDVKLLAGWNDSHTIAVVREATRARSCIEAVTRLIVGQRGARSDQGESGWERFRHHTNRTLGKINIRGRKLDKQ